MNQFRALLILGLSLCSLPGLAQNNGPSLDSNFSQPTGMTDQQAYDAKTFVHEGKNQRILDEACKADDETAKTARNCDANRVDEGVLFGDVEQHLGKAYSMVFGLLPGMNKLTLTEDAPKIGDSAGKAEPPKGADQAAAPASGEKVEKEVDDYCLYGAMAYEGVSALLQTSMQQDAEKESAAIEDQQVAPLVNLQKTHEARQKSAMYQSIAYGAVSACYVVYMTQGGLGDWKLYTKMGGAALLATLYGIKSYKHAKAAEAVGMIIKKLPDPGDCNPYTGTSCFCKEPSSKDRYADKYQEVCVPKTEGTIAPVKMGCGAVVDGKVQFDKQCKCKQTNTCLRVALKGINPKMEIGKSFMAQANKGFDLLSSGEFDHAKLNSYSTATQAMVGKFASKVKPKLPKTNLNANQKKLASAYKKVLPDGLANIAAVSPVGNSPVGLGVGSGKMAALDKIPESVKKDLAQEVKANYKSGGGYGNMAAAPEEPGFQMPTFGQPEEASDSTEVVSFAEKAFSKADVSNAPDTPIFDIISNRYRRSGWGKLQQGELK